MRSTSLWILFAIACAQVAPSFAQTASTSPPLPEGPLLFITRGQAGAVFITHPVKKREGDVAETLALEIYDIPITLARGDLVQRASLQRFDCAKLTRQVVGSAGYDADGGLVVATPEEPAGPIESYAGYEAIAAVVCDGGTPPGNVIVDGPAEAAKWSRDVLKRRNR